MNFTTFVVNLPSWDSIILIYLLAGHPCGWVVVNYSNSCRPPLTLWVGRQLSSNYKRLGWPFILNKVIDLSNFAIRQYHFFATKNHKKTNGDYYVSEPYVRYSWQR